MGSLRRALEPLRGLATPSARPPAGEGTETHVSNQLETEPAQCKLLRKLSKTVVI